VEEQGGESKALISLRRVQKSYGPACQVLRQVSFDVDRGEFLYIAGPSGAGKSTLLKLLYRAEEPDAGEVLFCGRDLARLRRESIPFLRRNIGVVFQDFRLLQDRPVFENIAIALEVLGRPGREIRARVLYVLDRVGLADKAAETVRSLSGGEQQRVAVARAVVAEPALILADEPTGNLDALRAADVMSLLDAVNRRGTAVVVATHDHMLMAARPRRTVALSNGMVMDFPEDRAGRALELTEMWALSERQRRGLASDHADGQTLHAETDTPWDARSAEATG
jgi:cell division transport system ATP-binding protein